MTSPLDPAAATPVPAPLTLGEALIPISVPGFWSDHG
jgi:hypothetical protein